MDNVLSWAFLAVAGWIAIGAFLKRISENPSTKITESEYITRVYSNLW